MAADAAEAEGEDGGETGLGGQMSGEEEGCGMGDGLTDSKQNTMMPTAIEALPLVFMAATEKTKAMERYTISRIRGFIERIINRPPARKRLKA